MKKSFAPNHKLGSKKTRSTPLKLNNNLEISQHCDCLRWSRQPTRSSLIGFTDSLMYCSMSFATSHYLAAALIEAVRACLPENYLRQETTHKKIYH